MDWRVDSVLADSCRVEQNVTSRSALQLLIKSGAASPSKVDNLESRRARSAAASRGHIRAALTVANSAQRRPVCSNYARRRHLDLFERLKPIQMRTAGKPP